MDNSTLIAIVISVIGLIGSLIALALAFKQTRLLRQSIESQTYMTILERAQAINLSAGMDLINSLEYTDYKQFQEFASESNQKLVRDTVDFFNDLSHAIRNEYLDDYYPIRIYNPPLLTCGKKLLPWWLDGIRQQRSNPRMYNHFESLCDYAEYIENERTSRGLRQIPKIGYRKFLTDQGFTSKRSKELEA